MDKKENPYCPFCGRELEILSEEYNSIGCKHCDFSIDPHSPHALSVLFYCPVCRKEEILNMSRYNIPSHTIYISSGGDRPIHHYRCMCGNYLAGSVVVEGLPEEEVKSEKFLIEDDNEGGYTYECKKNNLKKFGNRPSPKEIAEQQYSINERYKERRKLRIQEIKEELNESN